MMVNRNGDETMIAYMSPDMKTVTDWHGNHLGRAKVMSSWPMRGSWISDYQYQVEAIVDGVRYTGRTMGGGMAYKGKPKAKQS